MNYVRFAADAGFKTLKGEDSCILNSNMIASIRPRTTHGRQLEHLFCYAHERPNCLGTKPAAEVLLNYTEQFIQAYETTGTPWAAMAHIASGHEDSQTVVASIDGPLHSFLRRLHRAGRMENTLVVITSDHGLHYGPYFVLEHGRRQPEPGL